jgi:hypothetical protein
MSTKQFVSTIAAAAAFAAASAAVAASDPANTYGRAGGTAKWDVSRSARYSAAPDAGGTSAWYGRAGGPISVERTMSSTGSAQAGASVEMPEWAGRQGRRLPIDEIRG